MGERRGMGWEGRKEKEGRVGGRGKGGERGEDVEGPGKWSAPGPVLALGGPVYRRHVEGYNRLYPIHVACYMSPVCTGLKCFVFAAFSSVSKPVRLLKQ